MDSETPQQHFGGFWIRFLGQMIDAILMLVPLLAMTGFHINQPHSLAARAFGWIFSIAYTLGFWLWNGATPGMMLLGLKIVRKSDFERPSPISLIGRYIGYMVSLIIFSPIFIWIAVDRQKQALHDKLAGTVVLRRGASQSGTKSSKWIPTLSVLFVILLMATTLTLAYRWWRAGAAARQEAVTTAIAEGQQFGRTHTGEECFKTALSRGDSCATMPCLFSLDQFLAESLKMKPRREDLCKGVYDAKGVMGMMSWELQICGNAGRSDRLCSNLAKVVMNYCIDSAPPPNLSESK